MISSRADFDNRHALAAGLAERVARGLSRAISRQGSAVLALSGGTTPTLFFEHLSQQDISWEKVTVTLVDERQVDETSSRSNAKLVKVSLMQNNGQGGTFCAALPKP